MVRLALGRLEYELIEDIRDIGYGEIYDLVAPNEEPTKVYELQEEEADFIKLLRKLKKIEKTHIHDGVPKQTEMPGKTKSGHRFLKRIRF